MKLQIRHFLAYGLGDLGANFLFQPVVVFLLAYYTDVLGLPAAAMGLMFLVARIWDGMSDPMMGYLAQNTRTRWGSFRPWLLWGAIPAVVSLPFLFSGPPNSSFNAILWAYLGYLFFITAFTVVNVPYGALTAVLTHDYHERSKLTAYRLVFGVGGAMAIGWIFPQAIQWLGGGQAAFLHLGWILGICAGLFFLACFAGIREQVVTDQAPTRFAYANWWKNRPFWLVTATFFAGFTALSLLLTLLPFFFKYYLHQESAVGTGLLAFQGMTGLSILLWVWVFKHWGKKTGLLMGLVLYLSGFALLATGNELSMQRVLLGLAIVGAGNGAAALASWSMLADTVDFGAWKNGNRNEGLLFGVFGFFFKAGLGLGGALAGWGLTWAGYAPHAELSAVTIERLGLLVKVGPPILGVIMILCMLTYPITEAFHRSILPAEK